MASWDGAVVLPTLTAVACCVDQWQKGTWVEQQWVVLSGGGGLDASISFLSLVLLSPGLKWGPQLALSQLNWGVPVQNPSGYPPP